MLSALVYQVLNRAEWKVSLLEVSEGVLLGRVSKGLKIILLTKRICIAYEKQKFFKLNKEFHSFYETKNFIIIFTKPFNYLHFE
jgi:hypothetical protein